MVESQGELAKHSPEGPIHAGNNTLRDRTASRLAGGLVAEANARGWKDNSTAVVVRFF